MLDRTSLNHHKKTLRKAFIIVLQLSKGREDTFILISLRRLHSYQLQSCNDRYKISFYGSKWIHIFGYVQFCDKLFNFTYSKFQTIIVLRCVNQLFQPNYMTQPYYMTFLQIAYWHILRHKNMLAIAFIKIYCFCI